MGIKGLMKLLSDHAPDCVKERAISHYFNRVVAIDASMSLYQFLIAIRSGPEGEVLTNEAGEVTSHLQGMFYRTIRMLDNGIKPVFVFGQTALQPHQTQLPSPQCTRPSTVPNSLHPFVRVYDQMARLPLSSPVRSVAIPSPLPAAMPPPPLLPVADDGVVLCVVLGCVAVLS